MLGPQGSCQSVQFAMLAGFVRALWALLLVACSVSAQDLLAELDYGSFKGAYSQQYNISYWQKIPYAAPPLGENRYIRSQPPMPKTHTE